MKAEIEWVLTEDRKPEESGDYLTVAIYPTGGAYVTTLPYSKEWELFNVHDWNDVDRIAKYAITVYCWAALPDFPRPEEKA